MNGNYDNLRQGRATATDVASIAIRHRLDAFFPSREAGQSLTMDALRRGITVESVASAAADVERFADDAVGIVADEYRPALECRAGCCHCCTKPGVLVSLPELLRVVEYIRAWDDGARRAVAARAHAYMEQLGGRSFDAPTNDLVPCPLLHDGRCTVYDLRPLVCRGYNSTSAEACRRAAADSREQVPIFVLLKDVTDAATVGLAQAAESAGLGGAMFDLGTALDIVLNVSGDDLASLLGDRAPLRPAENATWVRELWSLVSGHARASGVAR